MRKSTGNLLFTRTINPSRALVELNFFPPLHNERTISIPKENSLNTVIVRTIRLAFESIVTDDRDIRET